MGYVYRARDTTLARSVALKVLPPEVVSDATRLSRFVQDARATSALNHPHVVAIYEIREAAPMRDGAATAGLPSLHHVAMELVTGDTVRTLIETRRLDSKRAIDLLVQGRRSTSGRARRRGSPTQKSVLRTGCRTVSCSQRAASVDWRPAGADKSGCSPIRAAPRGD
jgi:hypothetical protein